jgi:hypothetical protein
MKRYAVTIRMTVTKTYEIDAADEEEAQQEAHDIASVYPEDGIDEDYTEDCMDIELIEQED